jgi:hypothetical protein
MVPKLLSDEQKERRKELCLNLLQSIENESDLLNSIIICDETSVFMYDPETKRHWNSTLSPKPSDNQCGGIQHCLQNQATISAVEFNIVSKTKRQSVRWNSTLSPRPKKARMSCSKFKTMLIILFDIYGIVTAEWVPSGQTVNQQYYEYGRVGTQWSDGKSAVLRVRKEYCIWKHLSGG